MRIHLQLARVFVVAVQDGEARRRSPGPLEQRLLGGEVGLHGAVKIQVVARQIGENGGMEMQPVNPAQRQRVRGNFHGGVRAAGALQLREQPHQVQRFRRGIHGRQHAPRQMILDGADQRRGVARRPQHRIDQVRGGGLAVGSGDARQPQPLVRLAVKVARRQCQRLPAVLHLNPARGQSPGGPSLRFAGHRHRAARQRVLGELAPVGAAARKGKEQEARSHAPRIVIQSADVGAGKLRRDWLLQPNARKYLAQSHRAHLFSELKTPHNCWAVPLGPRGSPCTRCSGQDQSVRPTRASAADQGVRPS